MPLGFEELAMKTPAMEFLFRLEVQGADLNFPLYVSGGVFPYRSVETNDHPYKNQKKYYPSISDVTEVSVEIFETDDNVAWKFFSEWRNDLYWKDPNGKIDGSFNVPSKFKRTIKIFRLGPTSLEDAALKRLGVIDSSYSNPFFGLIADVAKYIPGILNIGLRILPKPGVTSQEGLDEAPEPAPLPNSRGVLGDVFGLQYDGCFPKSISDYSPRADGRDKVVFTVTFSVDDVGICLI